MTKESQDTVENSEAVNEETKAKTNMEDTEEAIPNDAQEALSSSSDEDNKGAAELENLRQQLLRVHADFDNFRKRTRQEKEDLQKFATKKLLSELLPVVDNFERALSSLTGASSVDEIKTGLEMVQRQMLQTLQQNGVEVMDTLNKPFDPNLHDAVMQEPADGKEAGIITEVMQKGYMLHGKVLRPAMVKVTV